MLGGGREEAITFYQQAAEAGDTAPCGGGLDAGGGGADRGGDHLLPAAAEAGDTGALWAAARMLAEAGRTEEAITFYQQAAEAAARRPRCPAGGGLDAGGGGADRGGDHLSTARAEAGDTDALGQAAGMLAGGGADRGGDHLATIARRGRRPHAPWRAAAGMLKEAGRTEEAITCLPAGAPRPATPTPCGRRPRRWRRRPRCWRRRDGPRRRRGFAGTGSSRAAGSRIRGRPPSRHRVSSGKSPSVK